MTSNYFSLIPGHFVGGSDLLPLEGALNLLFLSSLQNTKVQHSYFCYGLLIVLRSFHIAITQGNSTATLLAAGDNAPIQTDNVTKFSAVHYKRIERNVSLILPFTQHNLIIFSKG